jgi:TRAP-type C4-dicarboxylate transport system permease small subunit
METSVPKNSSRTIFERISQVCAGIAGASLIVVMMITVIDVVLRKFFNRPILGSIEIVEVSMVPMAVLAIAWGALKRSHIIVDLFRFPKRMEQVLDTFMLILGLTVIPVASWRAFVQASASYQMHLNTDILRIDLYPFYAIMGIGFALLTIAMVIVIIEQIIRMKQK